MDPLTELKGRCEMADRTNWQRRCAEAWRNTATLDAETTFDGAPRYALKGTGDDLPQPGYLGSEYSPGGIVLVGQNPGRDAAQRNTAEDARLYDWIRELRSAGDPSSIFSRFNRELADFTRRCQQ